MKKQKMHARLFLLLGIFLLTANSFSQDPNFHIYLCFGQSNMEGQGAIETQDKTVDSRFKVFQALDCSNLSRTKDTWYTAVPPLCQCWSGLTPADYFGRTMIANLPENITIGVVNVAVGGCDIRLFDKDIYQDYDSTYTESWFTDKIEAYEGNPYKYFIDRAKLAQQDGVIKGILLHQGETNTGDSKWPSYVKKIYNDILTDLSLSPDSIPLLAGEVLSAAGNCCASMNTIINRLPDTIPTAHVISASGCPAKDNAHFNSEGYRELGRRYAVKMLSLLGYEVTYGLGTESIYLESECATVGENWYILADDKASNESYVMVKSDLESISEAPTGSESNINFQFTISTASNCDVFARLICPTDEEDSYWVKMDEGDYMLIDGSVTSSWKWIKLSDYDLTGGEHNLSIAYCENGAKIDKICISNLLYAPSSKGGDAENICVPDTVTIGINLFETSNGYLLDQNYPNPFNGNTCISFEIPNATFVSLKVYNTLGIEVAELAGKKYSRGKHTVEFNQEKLSQGNYFYVFKTDKFTATRKMILQAE